MNRVEQLRAELRRHASKWVEKTGVPHYQSRGTKPTVLFERTPDGKTHGNFEKNSWTAICRIQEWSERLGKVHSQRAALPPMKQRGARELDSSNSSDALLMNCFCHPQAAKRLLHGLGLPPQEGLAKFGYMAKVQLKDGTFDATEIDMRLGTLFVEAKLTEKDFTARSVAHVERYLDLDKAFVVDALPRKAGNFLGYQIVRNVLAARQHQASLCVLVDQRRPDLLQEWWNVHAAIRDTGLRTRCGFRTWQQVRAASPPALAKFLTEKYGL